MQRPREAYLTAKPRPILQLVDKILLDSRSLVVSAPTGTGKTVLFEMAVCSLFAGGQGAGFKAVYLATSKFLVSQKVALWFSLALLLTSRGITANARLPHVVLRMAGQVRHYPWAAPG